MTASQGECKELIRHALTIMDVLKQYDEPNCVDIFRNLSGVEQARRYDNGDELAYVLFGATVGEYGAMHTWRCRVTYYTAKQKRVRCVACGEALFDIIHLL